MVGRLKDIIMRGGENIAPKEIEDVLDTHPNILESQVYNLNILSVMYIQSESLTLLGIDIFIHRNESACSQVGAKILDKLCLESRATNST